MLHVRLKSSSSCWEAIEKCKFFLKLTLFLDEFAFLILRGHIVLPVILHKLTFSVCLVYSVHCPSCMPSPLAPDPIRVQPCVCCLFWTNRNSTAVTSIFLYLSHFPIRDMSPSTGAISKWKYFLLLKQECLSSLPYKYERVEIASRKNRSIFLKSNLNNVICESLYRIKLKKMV